MFEPLTLSTSSAPASTAVRISPGSKVSTLTRMPAAAQLAHDVAERGKGEPGRAADVDDVGAGLRGSSRPPRASASRVSRGALLISATISMSHAP